ncbi:HYR domain-containing protein [Polaribacter atrinae]|uniref:HYR domain-containing protein n=1 Tax=Polaribacter atrinae TaxID=1333662 RepID=UPI0030F842BE
MIKNKLIHICRFCFLFILLSACGGNDDDVDKPSEDTQNPTITCQDNINVNITSIESSVAVNYSLPTATDNVSAKVILLSGIMSGEQFPVGTTTNTFRAFDEAGNSVECSFNVIITRDTPLNNQPYFIGNDPKPTGKKWTKVENLSDDFEGTTFNDAKWHRNASTDGFNWVGRPPGLFKSENVTVANGNLNVAVEKLASPQTVNGNEYTHGGAIVRSKNIAVQGQYYECRMKANSTVMSSTFWIAFKQNCTSGPVRKLELDIQECVGRIHQGTSNWATDYANSFASNTWRHQRDCDPGENESKQSPSKTILNEENNSRYFVYGCWWKSPTEILFYLDGEYAHSITPPTDFDLEGYITMAIETYDWNPVDDAGSIFNTGSVDELTTKYDWVRTWKLEDE